MILVPILLLFVWLSILVVIAIQLKIVLNLKLSSFFLLIVMMKRLGLFIGFA